MRTMGSRRRSALRASRARVASFSWASKPALGLAPLITGYDRGKTHSHAPQARLAFRRVDGAARRKSSARAKPAPSQVSPSVQLRPGGGLPFQCCAEATEVKDGGNADHQHDAGRLPAHHHRDPRARHAGVRPQRVRDLAGRSAPRRTTYAEIGGNAAPARERADRARRRRRRPGRHAVLEPPGAPRGVLRRAVHGRGAAHAQPAPARRRSSRTSSTTPRTRSSSSTRSLLPLLAPIAAQLETVEAYVVIGDGDTSVLGDKPVHSLRRAARRRVEPELRVARAGRAVAGVDVLHERHDRRPEGRRLLAPLDLPARARHAVETRAPASTEADRLLDDRADVPRQRVGHPVRRVPVRRVAADARPAHDPGRAGSTSSRPSGRRSSSAVPTIWGGILQLGARARARPVVGADGHVRRRGDPALADGGVREAVRRADHPGLGHDRDVAGRRHGAPAGRRRARHRRGDGLADEVRPAHRRACRCASSTTTATSCPGTATAVGEIEVRGPWITGAYHRDAAPEKFHDGWLRTGDIGTIDDRGFFQITDRAKDVIKSGGEWISSVELENLLAGVAGRARGRRHRHPRRQVDRAAARLRRAARATSIAASLAAVPRRQGRALAGAGELGVHRRGAQDHASASSTRRCCAPATPTATSTSRAPATERRVPVPPPPAAPC